MNHFKLILMSFFTLILAVGCTPNVPQYKVTIDALSASKAKAQPSTYAIKPLKKEKNQKSLIFQNYQKRVISVLNAQGYTQASPESEAKEIILFDYGIAKVGETTTTFVEPSVSFHIGIGSYYRHNPHYRGDYFGLRGDPFFHDYYGSNYVTQRATRAYYNRFITLLAKDKFDNELWRVDVSSVGQSQNLRKIIPLLIEASKPYIGTNTKEPIKLTIKDSSSKKE